MTLREVRVLPGPSRVDPDSEWVEVQRRPLTISEATTIMAEIRRSAEITGYSLAEWTGKRDTFALVRPCTGELVGAILVHHMWFRWSEIAVVFVLEKHRDSGRGRKLLQAALRTLNTSPRKKIIFFSRGPMSNLVADCGFQIFPTEKDFGRGNWKNRVFIRCLYKIQWLANVYRLRERRRKRRELESRFDFSVGVLQP
ncbi:GNAT family N-acetyltransferase [Nocardia concava]|uniref:GNAT family N-acetyltransferase n=1 Tax=Nocardia concava TaxID=257281 RepID=UPI0012FB0844|nr:GNAT family N-acetyltransferase [Nocardia concava]